MVLCWILTNHGFGRLKSPFVSCFFSFDIELGIFFLAALGLLEFLKQMKLMKRAFDFSSSMYIYLDGWRLLHMS